MALHNCDEVAVAGFGYDMNTPHAPLHYYETVKMSAIKEVSVRRRGVSRSARKRSRKTVGTGRVLGCSLEQSSLCTCPFVKQVKSGYKKHKLSSTTGRD